jgi:NTP pyrophosphatase (non-canonical NTP hydrolase)
MPALPEQLTLQKLQIYIRDLCEERGWDKATHLEKFLLFSEEVGELAKAIRNHTKLGIEKGKAPVAKLEEEFADVLNYFLDLANHFDVDLEKAFREKDTVNKNRHWN